MPISADAISNAADAAGDYCRDPVLLARLRAVAGRLRVLGDREFDLAYDRAMAAKLAVRALSLAGTHV